MLLQNEMPDSEILAALRAGGAAREAVWKFMYLRWRGIWLSKIRDAGGTADEAHEAHAEVHRAFEKTVIAPGFQLHSAKLSSYLTTCVFNRWLKDKGRRPKEAETLEEHHLQGFAENVEATILEEECQKALDMAMNLVSLRCKKILVLWAEGYSGDEIAAEMGFEGGAETTKKERYKCMKKLIEQLKTHAQLTAWLQKCRDHG